MKNCYLSIIIPVYNVEKYLGECLNSLLSQNIDKSLYEIICINDGSTDGSPYILDKFKQKYPNIIVVHQNNMGVSAARNTGIELANGKYFWFVDPDDFVIYNVLAGVMDILQADYPDILWVDYFVIKDGANTERIKKGESPYEQEIVKKKRTHWLPTWFFKKELIVNNNIRFYEGINIGDKLFCEMIKPFIKSKEESDIVVYCYRVRENSISTTPTINKINRLIYTCEVYYRLWQDGIIEYETAMSTIYSLLINIMDCLAQMSYKDSNPYITELKRNNLFPQNDVMKYYRLYVKKNEECKIGIIKRTRRISYTKRGYVLLRMLYKIYRVKNKSNL